MDDNVLDGPYYAYCRNYLSPFGMWPLQNYKIKVPLRTLMYLGCFSAFIPHAWKAYELRNNFNRFLLCLPSIIFYIQVMTKMSCMILNDDKNKELFKQIKNDFKIYTGDNLKILIKYTEQARKVSHIYICYFMGTIVAFNMLAFMPLLLDFLVPLNETRPRPIIKHMKYNNKRLENDFFVTTLHGFILNIFGMMYVVGFDTLLLNCTQHACALFQIVITELKDIMNKQQIEASLHTVKDTNSQDVFYRELVKVIIKHKRAIEFVDLVESTYAVANLLVIGITLGSITIVEFETVQYIGNPSIAIRFVIVTIVELIHILFHNYPGQRIMDHSLMVYQSCYNCEWYREDITDECKKLLSFMMLRSQKPSCLTGGGLYVLGLQNYATILKASLSYFTFLSSV